MSDTYRGPRRTREVSRRTLETLGAVLVLALAFAVYWASLVMIQP